ncbi:MAG: peptide chain release factor N(5)-glutamine methyltransferase [Firmicutes bacterium]|nr:peptide chain release factor N(5)-glutamine methyltransferase [Bacillota bacterium]
MREAIGKAASYLARACIAAARLEAELLLGKVLGLDRTRLYVDYDRPLTGEEVERFRSLLLARARERVPVAYLTGEKSFLGLSLAIPRGVFIPRPETEELVEAAVERMAKKAREEPETPLTFLDLCTGSGAIAVALARRFPSAAVVATDLSSEAVRAARGNVERHGLGDRVTVGEGDLFTAVEEGVAFDLIVSNPPYIPRPALEELPPEIKRHEPLGALDGGPDGLAVLRRIIAEARALPEAESAEEDTMLDYTAEERRPNSRLSCQIRLVPALDGLTVELPARQY